MAELGLRRRREVLLWLRTFRPRSLSYRGIDVARGAAGALVGIVVASYTARALDVGPAGLPFIVAPMGASAVLLFAAPASPLAQPWPVVGGNVLSTLVGVGAGRLFSEVAVAAAVAVGAAIALMMVLRCLHPPGGACALFAAVGTSAVYEQSFAFAVFPVAVNTVLLLTIGVLVNNLTGRRYPHVTAPEPSGLGTDPAPTRRVGLRTGDIAQAMARLDQGLDILPDDVMALVRDAEAHALDRRLGRLRVGTVMARDVLTVLPFETIYRVRLIMNQHHVKAVPVVDEQRKVVGIVTVYDVFNLGLANLDPASKVMTSPVRTIKQDDSVAVLVGLMSDQGLRHIPVVDEADRLVGIVTRAELIAVLNRALVSPQAG
ncbi:MAG TPA: HPP family protein [Jatrophihabitans sp.]|nr:HPP family protein [Jatrophihabitans sp.]